ncbi:hypothetical protein EU527_11350 [Candidatus Thorarchaeota archaeon]|nr:MAG: hypothetical protein EU527_11350 [Candidatus Thorarchaeota archaeon]
MSEEGTKQSSSLLAIIFFGFSSMIFAEVFSGASPLWFLDSWGWLVTLPLYWTHALLLLNLALRYGRVSLTQLYLWGIIFGLYEGWITKVIWAGYMGQTPQMGTFLGFAIGEFLVIGLFYHAVFSFIVPILVFQVVAFSTHKEETPVVYTSHLSVLSRTRRNFTLFGLIILSGSVFLSSALYYDMLVTLIASFMNFAYLVLLIWFVTSWKQKRLSLQALRLGKTGLSIVIIYLIALYAIMFIALLPDRIPSIGTILLTIDFYIIIFALIFLSPKDTRQTYELAEGLMKLKDIILGLALFVILSIAWCILAGLSQILSVVFYLWMIILAPILFIAAVGNVFVKIWSARSQSKEQEHSESL